MVSRLPSGCSCWQLPRPDVLRSQLVAAQPDLAHQHAALAQWRGRRRRLHGSHGVSAMDGRHRRRGRRRQDGDDNGSSSGREGSSGSPQRPPAQGDGANAWDDLATDDEWEKVTIQYWYKRGFRVGCTPEGTASSGKQGSARRGTLLLLQWKRSWSEDTVGDNWEDTSFITRPSGRRPNRKVDPIRGPRDAYLRPMIDVTGVRQRLAFKPQASMCTYSTARTCKC
jgi:hypothetical protein